MRLAVILSVSLQIYANTVATVSVGAATGRVPDATEPVTDGRSTRPAIVRTAHQLLLPRLPAVSSSSSAQAPIAAPSPRATERHVYRTKLSKLRLILLADMLAEMVVSCSTKKLAQIAITGTRTGPR
uniref:Uncharacterized protein n=1 Tax=Anopheles albimanus TaxID=7167 RepID=A0A182FZG7_ANOAL